MLKIGVLSAFLLFCVPFYGHGQALKEPLTYETLRSQIQLRDIRTRAELIQLIPLSMRKSVKLIHDSGSTVGKTSVTEPRMIFSTMSPTSLLTITINGNADSQTVEVAELKNRYGKNIPKVIQFNENQNSKPIFVEDPIKHFKGHPRMDCARCHGESFRWIWDGMYPTWPRAHGSDDEFYGTSTNEYFLKKNSPLVAKLQEFLGFAKEHPIYKHLDIDSMRYEDLARNNTRFNERLSRANAGRVVSEFAGHPNIKKYRAILMHAFKSLTFVPSGLFGTSESAVRYLSSKEIVDLLPVDDRELFLASIPELSKKIYHEILSFRELLQSRRDGQRSIARNEIHLPYLVIIRFVSHSLGLEMSNWSLALNRRHTGFAVGNTNDFPFATALPDFLRVVVAETDPDIYARYEPNRFLEWVDIQLMGARVNSCVNALADE